MKLNQFAQPKPILDEVTLASIRKGSKVKVQLTDGISDMFNETIILEVVDRDEHVLECKFIRRQIERFGNNDEEFKSPFLQDTVVFIKEAVFAVTNDH
jgi:hypothetical protein